jgi:hypothetical protein
VTSLLFDDVEFLSPYADEISVITLVIGLCLFDSRFKTFKGKLTTRWLGPYDLDTVYDNGAVKIKTIDDGQVSFVVNGH